MPIPKGVAVITKPENISLKLNVYLDCHRPCDRRVLALHKLRLDRGGVDALVVEELLHVLGDLHVLRQVEAADVRGGNYAIPSQLCGKKTSFSLWVRFMFIQW